MKSSRNISPGCVGGISRFTVFGIAIGLSSVIIRYFNIIGMALYETETDAPLIIDRYRILSLPVSFESMQAITGRDSQVFYNGCQMYIFKSSNSPPDDVWRQLPGSSMYKYLLSFFIREGFYHDLECNLSRDRCQEYRSRKYKNIHTKPHSHRFIVGDFGKKG